MNDTKLREEICRIGRSIYERGLTCGASGNISARTNDGGLLVTPTGSSLGNLDPARLSHFNSSGQLLSGDLPTKEMPLHSALYATRDLSGAIIHLHSTHSVALSMLPETDPDDALPPLTPYSVMRLGRVKILPYFAPGDPDMGKAVEDLRGEHAAIILANHGPVVSGRDLYSAIYAMEELEETAKLVFLLRGTQPKCLTPNQVNDLKQRFEKP